MIKKILSVMLLIILLTTPAQAHMVRYYWEVPTTGTAVCYYAVWVELAGGEWILTNLQPTDNRIEIDQEANVYYRIKVAGVDCDNIMGPISEPSIPNIINAPGACGQPQVY